MARLRGPPAMEALYTEVFDADLRRHIANPEASFALACWELARSGGGLPPECAFRNPTLGWLLPDVMILRRRNDALIYDHYGENIARNAGFDMTGKSVSDFRGALGTFYLECYARVAREGRPLGTVHRLGQYNERPMWERIILPLRDKAGELVLYVVNKVRKHEDDFAQLSARSRGAGIIALQFVRAADGIIADAMISGANGPAQTLTGRRLDELLDRSIRECFPGVVHLALWDRYLDVAATKQAQEFRIDYRMDGLDDAFDVKLHPFRDGVAIEFRVLKRAQAEAASQEAGVAA
jgi:hypothetical protein